MTVQGQVKNISSEPLEFVKVIITWYDQEGAFVLFDDSFIELDPILSGETSLFETFTAVNPAMFKFTVEFQRSSGGSIPHEDRR